jgi:hypothetical protein
MASGVSAAEFEVHMRNVQRVMDGMSARMDDAGKLMAELGNSVSGLTDAAIFRQLNARPEPPSFGKININVEIEALRGVVRFNAPSLNDMEVDIMAMILARIYSELAECFKNPDGTPRAMELTLVDDRNR